MNIILRNPGTTYYPILFSEA